MFPKNFFKFFSPPKKILSHSDCRKSRRDFSQRQGHFCLRTQSRYLANIENGGYLNILCFSYFAGILMKKSLRFASRMYSIGKHLRPPACGSLRGKNRGFRPLIDTVLRASLIRVGILIDEMNDAFYSPTAEHHGIFPVVPCSGGLKWGC